MIIFRSIRYETHVTASALEVSMARQRPEVKVGENCYATIAGGQVFGRILSRTGNLVEVEDVADHEVYEVDLKNIQLA